ncbi:predicted membrane protein [Longilinea arvoryzae]|uniref:Predicted membrane protein n=1 Tax=Longilinea arvoryzae TaxID=360412 RepID=A0A0S7BGD4_9CHLR|nr:GtrA family protein [Longilinea arvoryzae]GAP14637.1 predicted membrane protein [Longilinea arvoryzae]
MILINQKERVRFFKFAMVGVIGAVIDFGIFNLLSAAFNVPAVWASTTSFIAAVGSNFLWNRYWTYPDSRSKKISHQLTQFILVSLIGLAIRILMVALLEKPFINLADRFIPASFFLTPVTVGHNLLLALAVLVVMMWNFIANRYWTYNDVS